jgi:hypothetical protein
LAREPPCAAAAWFSCEHLVTLVHERHACLLPPGIPFALCNSGFGSSSGSGVGSCGGSGVGSCGGSGSGSGSGVVRGGAVRNLSFASDNSVRGLRWSRSSPSASVWRASGLLRALRRGALAPYGSAFRLCAVGGVSQHPPGADKLLPLPHRVVFALQQGKSRDGKPALLLLDALQHETG